MRNQSMRGAATLLAVALCAVAGPAAGQDYPTKPIRVIAPYPPGGSSDILARILGQKIAEAWGQRLVVDNRPGAGGSLGTGIAAAATADGYTWVVGSVAPIVLNPLFYKTNYQSLRDFEPVSVIASAPQLIVVNPSLPVKSLQDLVALAKSKPGTIRYGSSGAGTLPHIGGEMFSTMTGARIAHIPYKGSPPALLDLMAGAGAGGLRRHAGCPAPRQSGQVAGDRGGRSQAVPADARHPDRDRGRTAGLCVG